MMIRREVLKRKNPIKTGDKSQWRTTTLEFVWKRKKRLLQNG
jgi:hypothetical protein